MVSSATPPRRAMPDEINKWLTHHGKTHVGTPRMLRRLALEDMDRAAKVHRASFDHALPTLAGLHTPDEDRSFFREHMFPTCQLWGTFDASEMTGIIAF